MYFPTQCEGSENSADSLLGLTLHYSGTASSAGVTREEEESLEGLLALEPSLVTALKLNLALQKSFRARHQNILKELENNRARQVSAL